MSKMFAGAALSVYCKSTKVIGEVIMMEPRVAVQCSGVFYDCLSMCRNHTRWHSELLHVCSSVPEDLSLEYILMKGRRRHKAVLSCYYRDAFSNPNSAQLNPPQYAIPR